MAVHTQHDAIVVATMACEIRFDDAYRYLDHCGNMISRIRQFNRKWIPGAPNPQSGALINSDLRLAMSVDTERMVVSRSEGHWIKTIEGETIIRDLGQQTEEIYKIVTETIEIPATTRIGVRFLFIAPSDTIEDAERLLARAPQSSIADLVLKKTKGTLCGSAFRFHIEEPTTGYRRNINVSLASKVTVGTPRLTGFQDEDVECGVAVDVDTFTRPAVGHFQDTSMFFQKAYLKSQSLSRDIFEWLRTKSRRT